MKADYVTYQKATTRGVIGAAIHAVLALAFLIYGVKFQDHTAVSTAWFIGLGILVWVGLIIVYDQHRRERIEALEQESLTADQGGSVFEGAGDFRVAAKRLELIEKWILPVLSLVFGGTLIVVGVLRMMSAQNHLTESTFHVTSARGWAIALWIISAFVGFPFARYVAAMSKQPAWAKLRAGAGQSVAMALIALLSIIAHFVDIWGPQGFLRLLQVIVPGVMIILGAEVFVNFLLDLYRPRKAGEVRSIAADSKLMSFAAAPDRIAESVSEAINYQFGYNVTSTWLFQLLSRSLSNLAALGLLVGWLLSCTTVIQPYQRGMVLRFGELSRTIEPGLHFKLPWPIERVSIPTMFDRDEKGRLVERGETTTSVRTIQLGTPAPTIDRNEPVLWTNEHAVGEVFFIIRPSPMQSSISDSRTADSAWLSDLALIAAEIPLKYAVHDVEAFERLGEPTQREMLLKAVAQRAVMRAIKGYSIDEILGPSRTELAPRIRDSINAAFANLNPGADGKPRGAGVEILSVSVQGVHPAKQVAPAFEKVVQAEQLAAALIQASDGAAIETLIHTTGSRELAEQLVKAIDAKAAGGATPEQIAANDTQIAGLLAQCQGRVAQLLADASAARWTKHLDMRARAMQYTGQLASFEANEPLFRAQLYFEALAEAMKKSRLIVTGDTNIQVDFDAMEKAAEGGFVPTDADSAAAAAGVK